MRPQLVSEQYLSKNKLMVSSDQFTMQANTLSRLPAGPVQNNDARETKAYACSIASQAAPGALAPKQVEIASEKDTTLKLVRGAITSGDWSRLSGTMYKAVSDEVWVLGRLIMRGNRIVMPESL